MTSVYKQITLRSAGELLKHLELIGIVCGTTDQYSYVGNCLHYLMNSPSHLPSLMCPRENEACEPGTKCKKSLQTDKPTLEITQISFRPRMNECFVDTFYWTSETFVKE